MDFPKSRSLLLVAQPPIIHKLRLGINEDLRSRIGARNRTQLIEPHPPTLFELWRTGWRKEHETTQ